MIVQLGIAVFGLTALALAMGHNVLGRKLAPIIGLVGQVFWWIFAWQAEGWGVMVLTAAYTGVYAYGAWTQWRKP